MGLTAADDDDNEGSDAMSVTSPSNSVSAGSLPTVAGTSAVDSPAVASDELAVDLQGMTVDPATPVKQAPVAMSMWEGIAATAVLCGAGQPGDIVIMTIGARVGLLGKSLASHKGAPGAQGLHCGCTRCLQY